MADEAIIRIKLEKSDLDDAKGDGGGGPTDGGGQTAAQRNERRGEGRTGDPEADRPLTKGDLERLIADQRAGREDEGKRRAGEREAMDRAIEKASAGDATSLGELQKAHGMSASALARTVAEHGERKDRESAQAGKRAEASHVQQGQAVAAAASGNLGPIANLAKGAVKAVAGPELSAIAGKVAGTVGLAAGVVAAGTYGAMYAATLSNQAATSLTGIGGDGGNLTGPIQSLITSIKSAVRAPMEAMTEAKARAFFNVGTKGAAEGISRRLAVSKAIDREEMEFDEAEMKTMLKGWFDTLGPEIAELVWKTTKDTFGELSKYIVPTIKSALTLGVL